MPNPRPFIKAALKLGETRELLGGFRLTYLKKRDSHLYDSFGDWRFALTRPDKKVHHIMISESADKPGFGETFIELPAKTFSFMPDETTRVPVSVIMAVKREIESAIPHLTKFGQHRTGGVHNRNMTEQIIPARKRPFLGERP